MKTVAVATVLVCVAAVGCGSAWSQASSDVAVRVFSTREIESLVVTPVGIGAALRRCVACQPQPMNGPAFVSEGADGLRLNGESLQRVFIDGEVQMQVKDTPFVSVAGRWQITSVQGELRVVVAVPRERYVMAVLAREAAADDPPAALEALAIVVRSYAFANAGKHRTEGYDFSDSTESQAAAFGPVAQRVRDAVQDTAGETLWVGSTRVAAYFSENCGGMTEDAAALWGGAKKPWLVAHADPYCQRTPSQWHAEVSGEELRSALTAEGWKLSGAVTAVRVLTRTPSGRVAHVEVASGAQRIAITAESFRLAVDRALGWNKLRSDWYTVSFAGGRAVFEGRGYGHGVGLCQAGARAFALDRSGDAKLVSREILRFYFPGSGVRVGPNDHGWQQREGDGWTLYSVAPSDTLLKEGNVAWAHARQIFPVSVTPHPVVRLYPDTDLFRQATSESGWAVGATRGANVSLQPVSIVTRHEPLQALLLHEFLHVLVESEAAAAPLWLREGLVEWLAGLPKSAERRAQGLERVDVAMVEDGLGHATSWKDADAAHQAAGALVARMVLRYGTSAVRSWLRSGIPEGVLTR